MNRSLSLLLNILACACVCSPEPIPARHKQGSMHGFLLVKSEQGEVIAVGDALQVAEGTNVRSRLVFRFRDGSIDEESTEFSQLSVLRVATDHHIQKGPSFPKPLDVTIQVPAAEVSWRELKNGKAELNTEHIDLPDDLANGILPLVLENIPPNAAETKVSYLANDPKPRLVKLSLAAAGRDKCALGGMAYFATRYNIHVELGGLTGLIAPFIGKQPADDRGWVIPGEAPSFARMQGAFYDGGPTWTVELASPVWAQ